MHHCNSRCSGHHCQPCHWPCWYGSVPDPQLFPREGCCVLTRRPLGFACHHYSRLPLRGGRCSHCCQTSNNKVLHPTPSSMREPPHPFCSGWPLRPPEPYSSPSALLFISQNNECYTPGPGHYTNSVWFLHTSNCAAHLHCIHSHSYSDANDVGSNRGTFGIIHAWWSNANGDRCVTLSTGHPSTTTDCKGAARARALCPWLM